MLASGSVVAVVVVVAVGWSVVGGAVGGVLVALGALARAARQGAALDAHTARLRDRRHAARRGHARRRTVMAARCARAALSVATHAPPTVPRTSDAEMLRVEAVLEAADAAVLVCASAQRADAQSRVQEALCADAADAHLGAVLEAVAAATGTTTPRPDLHAQTDRCELVRWTLESIVAMRQDTLRTAHDAAQWGAAAPHCAALDADQAAACMELVARLNAALSRASGHALDGAALL